MNTKILILVLLLPLASEQHEYNNAERRVLGKHTPRLPLKLNRSPNTIHFIDMRFPSPITVTGPYPYMNFHRLFMPLKLSLDKNRNLVVEPGFDELSCLNTEYYVLVGGHHKSYTPGEFINLLNDYLAQCVHIDGFHFYNGLYRSKNFATLLEEMVPMLFYGEEPPVSLLESEMMRCLMTKDLTDPKTLAHQFTWVEQECADIGITGFDSKQYWKNMYQVNLTIIGALSHQCPLSFIIPEPNPKYGIPVKFENRQTDPGKFDDIIDIPEGFRRVRPMPMGAEYNSTFQFYTLMASEFRGKRLYFQHHDDIWAPSFKIYPTYFECSAYQLTLTFFDDNECNVKIKAYGMSDDNAYIEIWFAQHNFKFDKDYLSWSMPYVEMFLEEGELRIYVESAPHFVIGRFCPQHVHIVNTLTQVQIKMKRVPPQCDNGLALRVGDRVRWIEQIPTHPNTKIYNRTEDEYYDTDYDGNPIDDSSTASFEPWYIAAGIALLLVILFGVTAFLAKRFLDRMYPAPPAQ